MSDETWSDRMAEADRRAAHVDEKLQELELLREEVDYLRGRDKTLSALENAGVDNWEGYSVACGILAEWDREDEEDAK